MTSEKISGRPWKPKKIGQLRCSIKTQQELDKWFVSYASPTTLSKATGLSRTTLMKYRKEIESNGKSLQDLVSVSMYIKFIDLENQDWKAYLDKKAENEKNRVNLLKQAQHLGKQMKKAGFDNIPIPVPTTRKEQSTKMQSKFAELLLLEETNDPKVRSQARSEIRKMPKKDQLAYLKYKRENK